MTVNIQDLTPQQKADLIKKLKVKQDSKEALDIVFQSHSLLTSLAINEIPSIDAATLTYLPIEDQGLLHYLQGVFDKRPFIASILNAFCGNLAIVVLPIGRRDLYSNAVVLQEKLQQGLNFSRFLGARCISLAGLLPAATDYAKNIGSLTENQHGFRGLTTGHSTTTAAVILMIKASLLRSKRLLKDEIVGFLGLGSIGSSVLFLMLELCEHPKKIILCDILGMEQQLSSYKQQIRLMGYSGEIDVLLSKGPSPAAFYDASIMIAATNFPDCLDVHSLRSGTIVIDDSIPHCFNVENAKKRMDVLGDVLITEGGMLKSPKKIQEWRYYPDQLKSVQSKLPQLFWDRNIYEITSCMLASLLVVYNNDIEPVLGMPTTECCLKHFYALTNHGFAAADFRLEGHAVPDKVHSLAAPR